MRARSLGRWAGRVVLIAALGVGASLGAASVVAADEGPFSSDGAKIGVESPEFATPNEASWG